MGRFLGLGGSKIPKYQNIFQQRTGEEIIFGGPPGGPGHALSETLKMQSLRLTKNACHVFVEVGCTNF